MPFPRGGRYRGVACRMELVLIGVGLSMDAFAVALCKGLAMRRINYAHAAVIALFFGAFQAADAPERAGFWARSLPATSPPWITGSPLRCLPISAAR